MKDSIIRAINEKKIVEFYYHDLHRIAEPHIYGALNGVESILFFQIDGASKSGDLPQWRRMNVNEISNFTVSSNIFTGPRPFPSGKHSSFDIKYAIVKE